MSRLRSARGQITTEFAMALGFTTLIAIGIVLALAPTARAALQVATECVVSDVCERPPDRAAIDARAAELAYRIGGLSRSGLVGSPLVPLDPDELEECGAARFRRVRRLADLAADSYNDDSLEEDDTRIAGPGEEHEDAPAGLEDSVFDDETSGFRAALYELPPGSGQYVLAFAGTDPDDRDGDVATDVQQALGNETAQYNLAARLAVEVRDWVAEQRPSASLQFVGHSLGGGLAATAAMTTGLPVTTFNMARPSKNTVERYDKVQGGWEQRLNHYRVKGEFVNPLEGFGDWVTGRDQFDGAVGIQHELPGTGWNPVDRHYMGQVKAGLDKRIEDAPPC